MFGIRLHPLRRLLSITCSKSRKNFLDIFPSQAHGFHLGLSDEPVEVHCPVLRTLLFSRELCSFLHKGYDEQPSTARGDRVFRQLDLTVRDSSRATPNHSQAFPNAEPRAFSLLSSVIGKIELELDEFANLICSLRDAKSTLSRSASP